MTCFKSGKVLLRRSCAQKLQLTGNSPLSGFYFSDCESLISYTGPVSDVIELIWGCRSSVKVFPPSTQTLEVSI